MWPCLFLASTASAAGSTLSLHDALPISDEPRERENRDVGAFREVAQLADEREAVGRSEEHTSELQSLTNLVCRLLLEKKKRGHGVSTKDDKSLLNRTGEELEEKG